MPSALVDLLGDFRYAGRGLRRTPGFAVAAVLTLALGIGVTTAMFSLVDAVILRPLPFPQSQRLVAVLEASSQFPQMSVAWPNYLDWRDENHVFTQLAASRGSDMILIHQGPPAMVLGRRVTANYFSVLGVPPALGRTLLPVEDRAGAPDVVVVSNSFWRERLGADPHCLGRTLDLDGHLRTIVGVMPPGFPGLDTPASEPEFWTPLGAYAAQDPSLSRRGNHAGIIALGRLRPGVSLEQARADLDAVAHALAQQYPTTNAGNTVTVESYRDLMVGDTRPELLLLLAAVGLLLLIACANVANLLLARAATRQRAQAIRIALGATGGRLLRQHLAESLWLGAAGCGAGLLLAELCLRLSTGISATLPLATHIGLDGRVLAFAAAVTLLAVLACGVAPALQGRGFRIATVLNQGGRWGAGGHRLRGGLVVAETALALVLLAGAGVLIRSLVLLQRVDAGFDPQGVLSFIIGLPDTRYPEPAQQLEFFRQATLRLARLPGVQAVGGAYPIPLSGHNWQEPFLIVGQPAPAPGHEPSTDVATVRGDYFAAMGMHLLRGRAFTSEDTAAAPPVAVVDDVFAKRFAALGQRINLDGKTRTIVGVVAHVRNSGMDEDLNLAQAETFIPQAQSSVNAAALYFTLRAAHGDPLALRSAAIAQIQAVDADQPVTDVASMEQRLDLTLAQRRRLLALMAAFAGLALALAAVGIYGVISYTVAQRTHEIGVRMALGASRARVLALVIGQGLRLAAAGAAAGVVLALWLGRYLAAFLYGVSGADPVTLAAVALLLLAIAALACYAPARRATRVDPLMALRHE